MVSEKGGEEGERDAHVTVLVVVVVAGVLATGGYWWLWWWWPVVVAATGALYDMIMHDPPARPQAIVTSNLPSFRQQPSVPRQSPQHSRGPSPGPKRGVR
jgi:hypothetical protein